MLFVRISPINIIISSLMITSCGGGSGDSDTTPIVSNTPPVISSTISIADDSADGAIETSESFDLLLKITDTDNDTLTGSVELNNITVNLTAYSGNDDYSHQARFSLDVFGDYTATITASDGNNADVTTSYELAVVPNSNEVQTELETNIVDFVAGDEFDGLTLLGKSTNEFNSTIGYLANDLSESNIAYNAAPSGECAVSTPHKLLSVDVTSSGITIPETGMVFPLECLSATQVQKINTINKQQSKASKKETRSIQTAKYIAQHFLLTDDSETGISITQTGEGITLEGEVNNVTCSGLPLAMQNGAYRLTDQQIQSSLINLTEQNNSFILDCQRSVNYNNVEEFAPLLATITGELQITDSTSPTGSIDSIDFSIPYLTGGLDQGTICVSTTTSDNIAVANEAVSLVADDGLTEVLALTFDNSTNQYCGNLQDFDGSVHVNQVISDNANNSVTNSSNSYPIERNDAPVFSNELASNIILKRNQGVVTLVTEADVSDPENQVVTLGGELTFDTNQVIGEYSITAIATDPFNAQDSKTITINLSDNEAPIANISLSGNPSMIGGAIRDINDTITITLSSNDTDGTVDSSSLTTSTEAGAATDITNYSSTYNHDISNDGGKTRTFTYQVTDNSGQDSIPKTLELAIHLNTAPTYSGKTTYTTERGNCVTVEQKSVDSENDNINFSIEGDSWQLCQDSVIQFNKSITITDDYQAKSNTTISAYFTDCTDEKVWGGSGCVAVDTTPSAFSFNNQTGVALNSVITSNSITVSGINSATGISISGGSYSINGGSYTSAAASVNEGDTVQLKITSSASENTSTSATLVIGGKTASYSVTTIDNSNTAPVADAGADRTVSAGTITLNGSGSYDADGDSLTYNWSLLDITNPNPGNYSGLTNGNSATPSFTGDGGTYRFELTVNDGKLDSNWSIVSITVNVPDTTPDSFSFNNQTGVALNSAITSNSITVSGINSATGISISGGSYSINGGSYTSTAASVNNGDSIRLRVTSSGSENTSTSVTVSIGGKSGSFNVTTLNTGNTAPVADAGADRTVSAGTITLNGSGSYDADGDSLTYNWSLLDITNPNPGNYSGLTNGNSATPSFTGDGGTYRFELTVNDGKLDSNWSIVSITVN